MKKIILGENLAAIRKLPRESVRLIYVDPPFNTGKVQKRDRMRVIANDTGGTRTGFAGKRYRVESIT